MNKPFLIAFIFIFFMPLTALALVADHKAVAEFDSIPSQWFDTVRSKYGYIFYGHTSHGSQITTGIDMLASEDSLYKSPTFRHYKDDLGHKGDVSWVQPTRNFLDNPVNLKYKVVMWSWCGGASDNTSAGINTYLNAMSQLEKDYPDVTFVYMTGHLDGTGEAGNLRIRNQQIRDYAVNNDKVLFDFEDIESWDPNGNYYPNETDACKWCPTWCSSRSCPSCSKCAHSHCFNCYLKGKAFWWMMVKLAGWDEKVEESQPEPEPEPRLEPELEPEPEVEIEPDPEPELAEIPVEEEEEEKPLPVVDSQDQGSSGRISSLFTVRNILKVLMGAFIFIVIVLSYSLRKGKKTSSYIIE